MIRRKETSLRNNNNYVIPLSLSKSGDSTFIHFFGNLINRYLLNHIKLHPNVFNKYVTTIIDEIIIYLTTPYSKLSTKTDRISNYITYKLTK